MKKMLRQDMYIGQSVTVGNFQGRVMRVEPVLGADSVVEFWYEVLEGGLEIPTQFVIFGTGHDIPDGWQWRGTASRTSGGLVWHLYGKAVR